MCESGELLNHYIEKGPDIKTTPRNFWRHTVQAGGGLPVGSAVHLCYTTAAEKV